MAINILNEMHNDFMIYAKEVNEERAFPDALDGLKPGQRAALYTMYKHDFSSNKPHVKSAKISGAVIAELWPHSDAAIYESLVRMSQPWVNNIPEINWHGANGSLLGGPQAASSRYTECRLSESAEDGFFSNIKKDVVDMILNFSEDMEWPKVLPAIFPRLFVNGSQGIGYTIAQEWEPGNLTEFTEKVKEYLKSGKVDCSDIYPDYPTGGIIVNKDAIKSIYETGKGNIILRGTVEVKGNIIRITELPYQVYVEPFIQTIKELVNDEKITGIDDICNKSDDNGMLIEIECSGNPDIILNQLYKETDLQCTFSANQMALINGIPEMLTLKDYIKAYVDANIGFIVKEYTYNFNQAKAREEIVDGLLKAILDIDKIIATIKSSKDSTDARKNLIKDYSFTENQAKAIVDMRLGKLAHLEGVELADEKKELLKDIDKCNKILQSKAMQKKEFIKRLETFTTKYGWDRRTKVDNIDIQKERTKVRTLIKTKELFMVVLTAGGELKRIALKDYRPSAKVKDDKDKIVKVVKINSKDKFIAISPTGIMYKLQVNKIPLGTLASSGTSCKDLFGEDILDIFSGLEEEPYLFFITNTGKVKKIESKDIFSLSKNKGAVVMKLKEEYITNIFLVDENTILEALTTKGTYQIDTSRFLSKGRSAGGVKGINLKNRTLLAVSLLSK